MIERTVPIYQQIKEIVKKEIEKGELKNLSERYIIHRFNVSSITARKVLNELEDEGYIERKVGVGSIVVEKREKLKELGVIFYDIYGPIEPFVPEVLNGIEESAREKNYHLHLYTARKKSIIETRSSIYHLIEKRKIEGLFILSPLPEKDIRFIKEKGIPFLIIGNYYPTIETNYIIYNYKELVKEVCNELYKKGKRKMGIITSERGENGVKRSADFAIEGYEEFVREKGIEENIEELSYKDIVNVKGILKKIDDLEAVIIQNIILGEKFLEEGIKDKEVVLFSRREIDYPFYIFIDLKRYGKEGFKVIEGLLEGKDKKEVILKGEIRRR